MKIRPVFIAIGKILLLLSLILFLWKYISTTNLSRVLPAIGQIGAGFGYIIVTTFIAYWFGTLCWWYCLGSSKSHISKWRLFTVRHVCETAGLFNPASFAGADMLKVIVLRPYSISRETVLTSVIVSRILLIVSQLILISIAITWFLTTRDLAFRFLPPALLIAISLAVPLIACWLIYKLIASGTPRESPEKSKEMNSRFRRLKIRIRDARNELYLFFLYHKRDLAIAFIFSTLHWIVGSLEFYMLVSLLGYDVSIMDGLLLDMGVILFKSAGAFIPGQIGVEELGNKMMLGLIGIGSASLWLSISVLRRARQLFWILAGALFYLVFIRSNKIYA